MKYYKEDGHTIIIKTKENYFTFILFMHYELVHIRKEKEKVIFPVLDSPLRAEFNTSSRILITSFEVVSFGHNIPHRKQSVKAY